ncbi:MAG: thiamine-phosphate kinase [Betaproteobacteria bacterium]|nr:thiamine-phosphate kinase [Betaproteobacteria bacterium]
MTPEFSLIARYFTRPTPRAALGVGDDCALIGVADGHVLAVSTDTLVSGTHFFVDADPVKLGHKGLAVNLSDLAAMGAVPRYVTLALTLPSVDDAWLDAFSRGFFSLADRYNVELIGGDTTRGPLSMTLTVFGEVPLSSALRRDGAKAGDDVWVSGSLGGAALALKHMQSKVALKPNVFERAAERLHSPLPRIELGLALRGIASAAIDISDGLLADLGHICERSKLMAEIEWASVPLSPALLSVGPELRVPCGLAGGDDYELCFTAPAAMRARIDSIAAEVGVPMTRIGVMRQGDVGVVARDEKGELMTASAAGFDHFSS